MDAICSWQEWVCGSLFPSCSHPTHSLFSDEEMGPKDDKVPRNIDHGQSYTALLYKCLLVKSKSLCHVWLFATHGRACQAPLSIEFSRQEYWSGKLFPSPGDLPNPVLYKYFIYYVPGTVLSTLHKSPHLSSKQSYRSNFCFYFKNEGSELGQMLLFLSGS